MLGRINKQMINLKQNNNNMSNIYFTLPVAIVFEVKLFV